MTLAVETFLAWGRYLYWCELHHQRFDEYMARGERDDVVAYHAGFMAAISPWYSSLWVVIEGWCKLQPGDNIIDALIRNGSELCALFRRYRNGVFHFQPKLLDERFIDLHKQTEAAMEWAWALHSEFKRFLWEWPAGSNGSPEQIAQLRDEIGKILGWLPHDCVPARVASLEATVAEGERLLATAEDPSSDAAVALRQGAADARAARETRKRYLSRQQEYLAKRWINDSDLGQPRT